MSVEWIWQRPDWPAFTYNEPALAPLIKACRDMQSRLLGAAGAINERARQQQELIALLDNIINSSKIEGEQLDVASVRSSLAKRLGVHAETQARRTRRSEGLAELMLDITEHYEQSLDITRLKRWHTLLFPTPQESYLHHAIVIGDLRSDAPMRVVSGPETRQTVHFEAPPRAGLEKQLEQFLAWFEDTHHASRIDPLLRGGIAHFWFVTIHPFEDGNGRLTRAITDLALAQAEHTAIRLYSMSEQIFADRNGYYDILETSQKSGLDITPWLTWFLTTLKLSIEQALKRIGATIVRARFWERIKDVHLMPEQRKFLVRIMEDLESDQTLTFSAKNYRAITKVSKPTASRHLSDLLEKACIRNISSGRGPGAKYELAL